jgi:hypothetical protein
MPKRSTDRQENLVNDSVLDSLADKIKRNYLENVEVEKFIEFEQANIKNKSSLFIDRFSKLFKKHSKLIISTSVATLVLTTIFTFTLSSTVFKNSALGGTVSSPTGGQLPLTEVELKSVITKLNTVVYWAGPLKDAKYTLDVTDEGAAFVRYLPDGKGAEDTAKNYLIVATYRVNAAYDAIKTAGNEQDGIGLMTADGAAVYYNKTASSNVYLAFPDQNLQIEVFDPNPGRALQLANTSGLIKPIR